MGRYKVNLNAADVASTTRYVLVDKSDTSGFPHSADEPLRLDKLIIHADKAAAAGAWVIRIGVVEEVDASNGSVTFFVVIPLQDIQSIISVIDLSTIKRDGWSMEESTAHMVGSSDVDGSTDWQNDVNLTNPAGTTGAPGAGDIVVEVVEVDGTTTLTFSITAEYDLTSAR